MTGAGRAIGAAFAQRLHALGHRVALLDVDADSAAATASELDGSGTTAAAFAVDVRDTQRPCTPSPARCGGSSARRISW